MRFGSAELYDVIEACFQRGAPGTPDEHVIVDCLAVGQSFMSSGGAGVVDERVILFVKLHDGCVCSDELRRRVMEEIRRRRTARHVPERVSGCRFYFVFAFRFGFWSCSRSFAGEFGRGSLDVGSLLFVQIIQVQDIPYTLNGKRVEVPVKKVSFGIRDPPTSEAQLSSFRNITFQCS